MEQEQLFPLQELVQAHQLGELQNDFTIQVGKEITRWSVILLILAIFFSIYAHFAHWDITVAIIAVSTAIVFGGAYVGGGLFYYRGLHVYVYTAGLIYWRRKKRRVIRWEQIRRVDSIRGNLTLRVKNEPSLLLPAYIEWHIVLYSTIRREVASHRRSGQEADQQPVPQPTTSPSEQSGSGPAMPVL